MRCQERRSIGYWTPAVRTSNICDAENSNGTSLDNTSLVWEQRGGSGNRAGLVRYGAVSHVALAV
jgi:hypothetical protein